MFDDIIDTSDAADQQKGRDPSANEAIDYYKLYKETLHQIEDLADYIMVDFQDEIGKQGSQGAVDEAIRLLKEYKIKLKQQVVA
jgi:hypothetical protein